LLDIENMMCKHAIEQCYVVAVVILPVSQGLHHLPALHPPPPPQPLLFWIVPILHHFPFEFFLGPTWRIHHGPTSDDGCLDAET